MKRFLTILILTVLVLSSAMAVEIINPEENTAYRSLLKPYQKTSARMMAMGGAGVAGFSNQDALYVNPASLGNKGLVFNTPNIAITLYNFQDLVETGLVNDLISNASKINNPEYLAGLAGQLLPIYTGKTRNALLGVDAGIGFKFGRFAFAVDVQSKIVTFNPGSSTDTMLIPTVDAVASAGLGFRFFRDSSINFDIGVAARFNVRAFSKAISANDIVNDFENAATLIQNTPMYVGFSIPVDVGLNINLPVGFSIGTVLRNINGKFTMSANENYEDVMNANVQLFKEKDFTFNTPMSLDFGIGWNPNFGTVSTFINPSIALDFVNLIPLFQNFNTTNLLRSIRAGVEIELLRTIELRAGINQGYYSIGAGVNIFNVIHVEASYYRQEFGELLGDCPVDALTIRFNLLWER